VRGWENTRERARTRMNGLCAVQIRDILNLKPKPLNPKPETQIRDLRRERSEQEDAASSDPDQRDVIHEDIKHGTYFPPASAYVHNPLGIPDPKNVRRGAWHSGW